MKINILSRKLIKPSTPTPPNLKNYKLSYIDELSPLIIVPIILFYESSGDDTKKAYLEESLAKILPKFYPFAGRYIEEDQVVDCSDQGVDFIEAQVADHDLRLPEFIKEIKTEKLSALLPRDHVNDSVLSIQITSFKCGGVVIGVSFLHKVVDAASVGTFISAWANANNLHNKKKQKEDDQEITIIPNFDSPSLFPCKKFRNGFGVEASKTRNPNIVAKIFVFNKEAITRLKSKVTGRRAATRVGVVCALIAKVLITLDLEKNGLPRDCLITQAVNIRERTIPPLPKHSCGNLAAFAVAHCKGSDNVVGFEDLVEVLGESVGKTVENSAEILSGGEGGHGVFIDTVMKVFDATAGGKMNILLFSDWTKFGFYDAADFGWRKPVWASIDVMPAENLAVLMESKDGDGVEAWVHLNREDMAYFDQDEEIRSFVA